MSTTTTTTTTERSSSSSPKDRYRIHCRNTVAQIVALVRMLLTFTDREARRYALGSVLVRVDGERWQWVATDARRLIVTSWRPVNGATFSADEDEDAGRDRYEFTIPGDVLRTIRDFGSTARDFVLRQGWTGYTSIVWSQRGRKGTGIRNAAADQTGRFPKVDEIEKQADNRKIGTRLTCAAGDLLATWPEADSTFQLTSESGFGLTARRVRPLTRDVTIEGQNLDVFLDVDLFRDWLETLDVKDSVTIEFGESSDDIIVGRSSSSTFYLMPCAPDRC